MKKLYLFALGLYAAHICFSSFKDIENFLKNYNGEPLDSLNIEASKENMDALAMTLKTRSVQKKSRLLYMYLSLKDSITSPIIWLDKFYRIINLRGNSKDYFDQLEVITNFVFEKLKTIYSISEEKLYEVLGPDLNDFEEYGFFPWDDPYYEASEDEESDDYYDDPGNWIHPHLVKIDNLLRSR